MIPLLLLSMCLAPLAAQDPKPRHPAVETVARFYVPSAWRHVRREVVRASIPFSRGRFRDLDGLSVKDHPTAWRVLTRWPDSTVQWAQAQFVAEIPALTTSEFEVVDEARPIPPRKFEVGARLFEILGAGVIRTEVEDGNGVVYTADLRLDKSAGPGGLLVSTPLVRTYRFRSYHRPADPAKPGIGRDFLSLTAYLNVFHGFDHAELLVIVGNDYLGADDPGNDESPNLHPLGSVWLRRFSLVVESTKLAFVPRWIEQQALKPPERIEDAGGALVGFRQHLLGPGPGIYLADGSCKGFPLVLYAPQGARDGRTLDEAEILRRQSASAMVNDPLYPIPSLADVRRTRAMNAHGGPAPESLGMLAQANAAYQGWLRVPHFGPFGTWGDIGPTATTGTPRNTTVALHLAVRAGSSKLLQMAEGMCLQQLLRPYHLFGLRVGPDDDIYLEGLPMWNGHWVSAETLGRSKLPEITNQYRKGLVFPADGPYHMNAFDYEHFTVDLLYDFYCLTGSSFAKAELAMLGEQLKGMLRRKKYFWSNHGSSRGEGWCMKGLVLCYQATGDESLKAHAIYRLHHFIDKARGKPPSSYAIAQGPHPNAFGPGVEWDAPWQQAAYVMGMTAGYRYFEDPLFRTVAIDVANYMANQGWVEGVGPKYFVAIKDPTRYKLPNDYSPMGGTAEFEASAFVLAAELANEVGRDKEARLFRARADAIVAAHRQKGWSQLCSNKWFQIYLDRKTK